MCVCRERCELEAGLRKALDAAQSRGAACEAEARELRQQKYELDALVSELSHKLGAAEGSNRQASTQTVWQQGSWRAGWLAGGSPHAGLTAWRGWTAGRQRPLQQAAGVVDGARASWLLLTDCPAGLVCPFCTLRPHVAAPFTPPPFTPTVPSRVSLSTAAPCAAVP